MPYFIVTHRVDGQEPHSGKIVSIRDKGCVFLTQKEMQRMSTKMAFYVWQLIQKYQGNPCKEEQKKSLH